MGISSFADRQIRPTAHANARKEKRRASCEGAAGYVLVLIALVRLFYFPGIGLVHRLLRDRNGLEHIIASRGAVL
jgi:hypothetical protein